MVQVERLLRAVGNGCYSAVRPLSRWRDGVTDPCLAPNSSLEAREALSEQEEEQNDGPGTHSYNLHRIGRHGSIGCCTCRPERHGQKLPTQRGWNFEPIHGEAD